MPTSTCPGCYFLRSSFPSAIDPPPHPPPSTRRPVQLTTVSPKKTVEGAAGGLLCSIAVALGLFRAAAWPDSPLSAAALGTLIFFSRCAGVRRQPVPVRWGAGCSASAACKHAPPLHGCCLCN